MSSALNFLVALPGRVKRKIKYEVERNIVPVLLSWKVIFAFERRAAPKPHGLTAPLIVSLTSYSARFAKLPLTLKCLLSQSMGPDRVILWIAYEDKNAMTPAILSLQESGLEIAYCDNIRSYKKIIPTLQYYPNCFIVTADDDVYYWPTWLAEMIQSYENNPKEVLCHRAHKISLKQDDLPLPYTQWDVETKCLEASPLIFQTGCGGVLYPPGVFHPDVLKADVFTRLCPNGDDIWLYWMMRLNGAVARKIETRQVLYGWTGTQQTALFHSNVLCGGNDAQITAMMDAYGFQ